ncbi:MAG: flavodoxin [Sphingobacteriales bacterium]|nr:flavodoxin [Sphingobacteriales bacterium]
MKKIALIYSFNTTKTRKTAEKIAAEFGEELIDHLNAEEIRGDVFMKYNFLILGVPTWFDGELPNYWDEFVPELEDLDLRGKKIALFGLGDQVNYSENFGDGMGILGEILENCGAQLVGFTSSVDYEFEGSRALWGDLFCGLMIDQDNQAKLTPQRIKNWVQQIRKEFNI